MLFDRAAKGKKSKELKGELKDLKKSLLNAGGEKAYVNEALRDYQAALEQGDTLREQYEEARSHLAQSRAAIERLLECMKESPVSEVKKSLDELMGDLDQVYHDCSIRDDDLDFQSTIQSLKQMAAEYEEHAAKAAVLKDAAGWEEPDFFALAYYLGHENRGSLREMENAQRNSYLVDYCGERFWNRFLELCRRAEAEQMVRFMTRKYIYNTEESPSNS